MKSKRALPLQLQRQKMPLPDTGGQLISRRLTLLLRRIARVMNNVVMLVFGRRGINIPEAR